MYSDTVKDHFANPCNVGEIEHPDASATAKNEADGDMVQIHLRIENGIIADAKMKVTGCVAAIASASLLTETIRGRSVSDALAISKEDLAGMLGGLPEHKIRCSLTCVDALHKALNPE
jgi:NifU-like protein involved in Fe-S cluster formation